VGRVVAALLIFTLTSTLTAQQAGSPPAGFTAQSEPGEASLEQRFKSLPDPQRMRANMERLSARPHHVGSPYDKENAEWILSQYKQWGWDAHIEESQVLFPTPQLPSTQPRSRRTSSYPRITRIPRTGT
jgi:N-acetylated-alpha-linked acidic dipeptidase